MSQELSKLANEIYLDVMTAYHNNNASGLTLYGQKFLELIEDIDTLLASDDNFLLGTWLESAKKLAWAVEELLPTFSYLSRSLEENKDFPLEEWRKDWISYSNKRQAGTELYYVEAVGDALAISKSLAAKYLS